MLIIFVSISLFHTLSSLGQTKRTFFLWIHARLASIHKSNTRSTFIKCERDSEDETQAQAIRSFGVGPNEFMDK